MLGDVGAITPLILGVLLVFSAFFSGAEAALLSVQRVRILHMVSTGSPGAARVARMIEHPERLLPPILLGNNLVNTAAAALATVAAITWLDSEGQGVVVATVAVTVVVLVFGETIPKTIAARHAERVSLFVALPLLWVQRLLWPFAVGLEWISGTVAKVLGGGVGRRQLVTEEEIRTMVLLGIEAGAVETGEAEMIQRTLGFGDRTVREVMTPRPEVVWVKRGTSLRDFLPLYDKHYHTRFPVWEGHEDNVVGLISVKDILRAQARGAMGPADSATSFMRTAHFVPETKPVHELLDEMRGAGHQMAIVIDEFGGIAGLVTLKRLVEGIVGPVGEEGEAPREEVVSVGENSFQVDAGILVELANQRMGLNLPEGEYDTVAGFILEQLGHLPEQGELLAFADLRFRVLEMKGVRIAQVLITRMPPSGPQP